MKLTLDMEGSASAVAAVLAAATSGGIVHSATFSSGGEPSQPNDFLIGLASPVPTTGTASPGPVAMPGNTAPMASAAAPMSDADDDDDGTPSDAATDNTGLPWDERIHSGSKALTAKGVWKKRKGVSDDVVRSVEAELRAPSASALPQPVAIPTMGMPAAAAPQPMAQPMGMPVAAQPQPMAQPMPAAAQPMPAVPQVAEPVAAPAGPTFPEFMQTLGTQMQGETPVISQANVAWVAEQIGVGTIGDLGAQPEKIQQAVDLFRQYNMWPN